LRGNNKENRVLEPATTRTDRDLVMVVLGLLIIVIFLVAAYLAITEGNRGPARKIRGPVKFPQTSGLWKTGKDFVNDRRVRTGSVCSRGMMWWSPESGGQQKTPQTGLLGYSMPLPGGACTNTLV
jgi:hypothetical protein